jgi:hypothetical protein
MSDQRDQIAKIICDESHRWGDRLFAWDESGEDVRDSFRESADKVLAVLAAVPSEFKWLCQPVLPPEKATPTLGVPEEVK